MAQEYAKVLQALEQPFIVVTRSPKSAETFSKNTGHEAIPGGIDRWLTKDPTLPSKAIIAVTEDQLGSVTRSVVGARIKSILVEKPGGLTSEDIEAVGRETKKRGSSVYIGYNRRFYASVQKALEIIKQDKGVLSCTFDFTERSNIIKDLPQSLRIKRNWFLANSTHVIDLAFFLAGTPKQIHTYVKGTMPWHRHAHYVGSGITDTGALFSYHANWQSAGRWGVEIATPHRKLFLRPLEKLQVQNYGSFDMQDVTIDDALDRSYKPGLYRQVESFLGNKKYLLHIEDHVKLLKWYNQINP